MPAADRPHRPLGVEGVDDQVSGPVVLALRPGK
jgi:hypothetical protein